MLLWVQLHLSCIYGWRVDMIILIFLFFCRINITIIVSFWVLWLLLLVTSLPIWLGNSILHLSCSLLLKLLSHLILFSKPDVLRFTNFICVVSSAAGHWSCWLCSRFVHLFVHISSSLVVDDGHVKHGVIKVFCIVLCNIFLSTIVVIVLNSILTLLWIFGVDINELVILQWQLLFVEIQYSFT